MFLKFVLGTNMNADNKISDTLWPVCVFLGLLNGVGRFHNNLYDCVYFRKQL